MDLSKDSIFQKLLIILGSHYKIKVHMVPGYRNSKSFASSKYDFDQYHFVFSTHRGVIEVMFPDINLIQVIERTLSRGGRNINPSYPSETNILEWLGNEYLHLYNTTKKGNPFTDGYKSYNPNDGKGTGNKGQWKSAFGGAEWANPEEEKAFNDFKSRAGTGGGYSFDDADFDDFFNRFFGGNFNKGGSTGQQQKTSSNTSSKETSHSILGLDPLKKPTKDELKKAYRNKCMEWHPDKNQHRLEEANEMMKKINNANETLKSAYGYK